MTEAGGDEPAWLSRVAVEAIHRELDAPEPEAVAMMVALSTGEAPEEAFAAWVRRHLR